MVIDLDEHLLRFVLMTSCAGVLPMPLSTFSVGQRKRIEKIPRPTGLMRPGRDDVAGKWLPVAVGIGRQRVVDDDRPALRVGQPGEIAIPHRLSRQSACCEFCARPSR